MKARIFLQILILFLIVVSLKAQISGFVFRDFNSNGIRDVSSGFTESLVSGITITAFPASGISQSTTTANDGSYSFTGLALPVRIEFSGYSNSEYSTFVGSNSTTSVQFYSTPTTNANFGINYPPDYCQSNPPIVVSCFVNGDITGGSPNDVLVKFNYNSSGASDPSKTVLTSKSQMGSVWGTAFSPSRNRVYSASVIIAHVGLGPSGIGAIYSIDPNSGIANGTLFATIPNAGSIGSNASRGLDLTTDPSRDPEGFSKTGREGLGDIDISADEKYLYVTNVNDKRIYIIDIDNPSALAQSVAIPNPGCTNGVFRPFGLKVRKGKLYVGGVCDASSSTGTRNDLKAIVYSMDLSSNTFDPGTILDFPLNYYRDPAWAEGFYNPTDGTVTPGGESFVTHNRWWYPWEDTYDPLTYNVGIAPWGSLAHAHPMPILTDLEFDENENMILGFSDLLAFQIFYANYVPTPTTEFGLTVPVVSGGDILRAEKLNSGNYQIEPLSTTVVQEFFVQDRFSGHQETTQGGLLYLLGKNEVVTTAMDPIDFNTGGIIKLSTQDGNQTGTGFQVFDNVEGLARKGIGLGDPEMLCNNAPIQIGNRVWVDTDGDGVQDADEAPIADVTVQLLQGTTVIATATTDANGNYYFSNATGTNTESAIYGITQLIPNISYTVRIPNVQGGNKQAALGTNTLTTANVGGAGQPDVSDSDGTLVGDNADVTVNTSDIPMAGANNHTFDFGFSSAPNCTLSAICTPIPQTSCTPVNGSASVNATYGQGNITYVWTSGETTSSIFGKVAGTYTVTVTDDFLPGCIATCQTVIVSSITLPTAACTPMANTNCATPNGSATVTTNANQILWSTGATTATITGLAAGTYTVTVTNTTTGCTNTCQAVVGNNTVNPTCTIAPNSQPSCANLTGGSVTVTPSPAGTYSYVWSDSGTATANRTGLTGGTYTVTVTNTTTGCSGNCNITLDTPMNCCNINAITAINLECLDNGTPNIITDNMIRFSAQVTNANQTLTGYNVIINGGTTITPNTNVPYGITQFTLGTGTAGGGATFTVTVTDITTSGCTQTFQVTDPGTCNNSNPNDCLTPKCGTATIQVNGN